MLYINRSDWSIWLLDYSLPRSFSAKFCIFFLITFSLFIINNHIHASNHTKRPNPQENTTSICLVCSDLTIALNLVLKSDPFFVTESLVAVWSFGFVFLCLGSWRSAYKLDKYAFYLFLVLLDWCIPIYACMDLSDIILICFVYPNRLISIQKLNVGSHVCQCICVHKISVTENFRSSYGGPKPTKEKGHQNHVAIWCVICNIYRSSTCHFLLLPNPLMGNFQITIICICDWL